MRDANLRPPGALRAAAAAASGADDGDDAHGLRTGCSRRRAGRSTARPSHGWKASFARPGARSRIPGLYLAGGSAHPGPGVPMAALSGRLAAASLLADLASTEPVGRDGYAWWYVDALSDDGQHGLTIIAFIGSVFSPYYAWARRRGPADPLNHCALNVALYGTGGNAGR